MDNNLNPKDIQTLKKDCESNKNVNEISKNFQIPPLKERASAIKELYKVSTNDAIEFAKDPWYSPLLENGKIVYLQTSPRAGQPNTFPKNHNVYKLVPKYFPAPNKAKPIMKKSSKKINKVKTKQPLANQLIKSNHYSKNNDKITWRKTLEDWQKGFVVRYRRSMGRHFNNFVWETYPIIKNKDRSFKCIYRFTNKPVKRDRKSTQFIFNAMKITGKSAGVITVKRYNSIYVVPIQEKGKDFTTIKSFIDNASLNLQKQFWKQVAIEVRKMFGYNQKIYMSSNAYKTPYMHVVLHNEPIHYNTKMYNNLNNNWHMKLLGLK